MCQKICLFCIFLLVITQATYTQDNNFESIDGIHIAYIDEGEGEPVLLLHGFLNTKKAWNKTLLKKDLLNAGYRVIIPDLRGNGDSDKPQEEKAYQNNAEVKDLVLLMSYLNIKKYKAIGYSRGSIVLAKLLAEDKRIEKAVLGGMGIDFTNPQWDRRIMFAKAFDGDVNEITKGAVEYAKSINADMRSLHLQQKYQPVTSIEELRKIEINVLVICGDEDSDNGNATALMQVFKNGSFVNVPGDHNGTYRTANFSNEILKFLK